MQLTKNFKLSEFTCRDGAEVPEEFLDNVQALAENLQILRDFLNRPIRIISGYRSPEYNAKVKGVKKSQHLVAKAADIVVRGIKPKAIHTFVLRLMKEGKMSKGGVGLYRTFVHYDIRGRNARWYGKGVVKSGK
jgi:uncharacterized protein YcbK (DUF882 family)